VVGIRTAVGRSAGSNLVLAVVATALVALAFQPLRWRLQQLARRLLLGTPPAEEAVDVTRLLCAVKSRMDTTCAQTASAGWLPGSDTAARYGADGLSRSSKP
jgi:hypothetical protein